MNKKFLIIVALLLAFAMLPINAFAATVASVVPMEREDFKVIRGYLGDNGFLVESDAAKVNGKSGAVSTARYIDVSNATGGIVFTVTYLDDYSSIAATDRGNYHFGVGLMDEQCFIGNANDLGRGFGVDFCFTNSNENAGYRLKSYTYDGYASLSNNFTGKNKTYATGIETAKSFQLKFEKTSTGTWKIWNLNDGVLVAELTSSDFGTNLFVDNKAYLVFGCYGATPMNMSVTVNQVYGFSWGECFNAVRYGESIELEDNVLANFYVSYNDDALALDGKVKLVLSGNDGLSFHDTEKIYSSIKDGELVNESTYRYTVPIPAAKGSDKINIEISGNDGRVFRWSTSLAEYLESLTNQDSSSELAELKESLMNYCFAAETYFDLTYTSAFEKPYYTYQSLASAREDQKLIKALVDRMGRSAAVYVGSSSVLYEGFKQKLDTEDYSKVTKLNDSGDILIAAEFAEKYFERTLTKDSEGYVNLTDACRDISGVRLYCDSTTGLAVILPAEIASFAGEGTDGGYTNAEYRARMIEFFTEELAEIPEPQNNSEQSRVVISSAPFVRDGDYTQRTYTACSSPSLTSVTENGATVLYASHEFSVTGADLTEYSTVTVIKRSADGGATWTEVSRVKNLRWATAQAINNTVYLLGNHITTGEAMIAKVEGNTVTSACVALGVGGGGPNTVAIANGRVYKAYNSKAISADISANLLDSASWTVTANTLKDIVTSDEVGEASYQLSECNLVAKDGTVYAVMRLEGKGKGYAAIAKLSVDGSKYEKCGSSSLISNFPTGVSKFMIKYDEATSKFICLSNVSLGNAPNPNERTVLAISTSSDLRNWTTHDYLVVEREMMNADAAGFAHGWQYPDFVIDGDTLYYVVRESSGASNDWHCANYVSFYTLENYKSVLGG